MHAIDQNLDCFRRRELGNPVTEIEYMAAAMAEASEDFFGFALHHFCRCKQHSRVEIALQRDTIADARSRLGDVHAPVETDRIAADCGDGLQPVAAAFGEYDRGNARAGQLAFEPGDDALQIG